MARVKGNLDKVGRRQCGTIELLTVHSETENTTAMATMGDVENMEDGEEGVHWQEPERV